MYISKSYFKVWYEIHVALVTTDSIVSHDTQLHSLRNENNVSTKRKRNLEPVRIDEVSKLRYASLIIH